MAILIPLFILLSVLSVQHIGANTGDFYIYNILEFTFLLCLLTFYKLTIIVDSEYVSFKLGLGLISKKYKISNLKVCKPVTNSVFNGIGIRMMPNGWLYNVSGLKAIELQFINKDSVIRIGTNNPEEISQLIQSRIGGENNENSEDLLSIKKGNSFSAIRTGFYSIIVLVILIPLVIILTFQGDTKVQFDVEGFKINGIYGVTIPYADIEQIDTVSKVPKILSRTNGYAHGKTLVGNFRFKDNSDAKLFIKKGFGPFILIKSKNNVPIYINFEKDEETIELFNKLKTHK